jgi:hypothetical protein
MCSSSFRTAGSSIIANAEIISSPFAFLMSPSRTDFRFEHTRRGTNAYVLFDPSLFEADAVIIPNLPDINIVTIALSVEIDGFCYT